MRRTISIKLLLLVCFYFSLGINGLISKQNEPIPVVMFHGMGDTAYGSIIVIKKVLESEIPNIYVTSIRNGNNVEEDFISGFIGNLNDQVSSACEIIRNDPKLQSGYNSIGFSQGGQILRAIAQRCPNPPMRNLISLGGQHQGVYGLPHCFGDTNQTNYLCNLVRQYIRLGAYTPAIQNMVVQAEFWHDPLKEKEYQANSIFLADINNERQPRNQSYKDNLLQLKNLVLVKFTKETIVEPKESEWFEFYKPGQANEIVPLRQSPIYTEDWLGLKQLDQSGRLKLLAIDGDHLRFNMTWFRAQIVKKFLL